MKIRTFGNKGNEAVLLLHPMFISAEFFDAAIDQLKNYYLIVPTYSGHYENSTYLSMEEEEKAIDEFLIVDSAPVFKFPKMIKNFFFRKYRKCLLNIRQHPQNTVKELNQCFHGMGEAQQYVAPVVTIESLRNLIESCYGMSTPELSVSSQRKITFVYGKKDIAGLCLPRIRKYKDSRFVEMDSLGHCGYFMESTEEYLRELIK